MKNLLTLKNLVITAFAATLFFAVGADSDVSAQRKDPFEKAPYEKTKTARSGGSSSKGSGATPKKKGPQVVPAPSIEARINYYKVQRERAAEEGRAMPKVTSVLLLSEMSVMGIIKTPRGFAAMVEATPIKLSYTIRPGEKFFDGQLVAVEENRLVFRKVTKYTNSKQQFVSSVEYKPLRKYSMQQDLQGTTPDGAKFEPRTEQAAKSPEKSGPIVSPLDEMNSKPAEKAETAKKSKKSKKGRK